MLMRSHLIGGFGSIGLAGFHDEAVVESVYQGAGNAGAPASGRCRGGGSRRSMRG